tara:strand:- start:1353 stop:1547 length:195 start_codon:yes stop_codon:yes gene_type:complete
MALAAIASYPDLAKIKKWHTLGSVYWTIGIRDAIFIPIAAEISCYIIVIVFIFCFSSDFYIAAT